jgi:hypothetical protein
MLWCCCRLCCRCRLVLHTAISCQAAAAAVAAGDCRLPVPCVPPQQGQQPGPRVFPPLRPLLRLLPAGPVGPPVLLLALWTELRLGRGPAAGRLWQRERCDGRRSHRRPR